MLMHAVIVDDCHVTGLPVVTNAIVNLVTEAIENVERGFVDVTMLLRAASRRILSTRPACAT